MVGLVARAMMVGIEWFSARSNGDSLRCAGFDDSSAETSANVEIRPYCGTAVCRESNVVL
jgi:hypothetical protein